MAESLVGRLDGKFAAYRLRYLPEQNMVELVLVNGFQIAFPRQAVPELARLPGRVPRSLRLRDRGTTVALPFYRVNLNIAAMLRTLMGVDVGTAGGGSKSAAKAAAARANGLRGGRPRK